MNRLSFALCLSAALAACASRPPAPVPPQLEPAAGEAVMSVVAARGVQVYECRASKDNPSVAEWTFVAPEAELMDRAGKVIGKHYAGPHWEAADGSKIVGAVKARADSPQAGAIPWLLLSARSVGSDGVFSRVTSIQRDASFIAPPSPGR